MEGLANYGNRPDGTPKGRGFYGELPIPDKPEGFMTEFSVGLNIGGKEMGIPLINPFLSESEIISVLQGKPITEDMYRKTAEWAKYRLNEGKSPFIEDNEQQIQGPFKGLEEYNYGRR